MKLFALLFCLQDPGASRIDREAPTMVGFRAARVPELASDGEFLRRISLDLTGVPPTAAQARAFIDDPGAFKRMEVVDRLIASDTFAAFWGHRLSRMLLGKADELPFDVDHPLPPEHRTALIRGFDDWLVESVKKDIPWNRIVSQLLTARGLSDESPAVAYKLSFRGNITPFQPLFAGYMPKQLLGIDMRCALCHDHPFDQWSMNDAASLAAFLPGLKLERDPLAPRVRLEPDYAARLPLPYAYGREVKEPRFFLGGDLKPGEDFSEALARLVTAPTQFDRAMANRVWAWMTGRGVVDPPDDFNRRNKPSSTRLLRALEEEFRASGRSIKAFARTVALTRAYQRSSEGDPPMAQRAIPLDPEQLVNALQTATLGAPRRDAEEMRRIVGSYTVASRVQGCEIAALPCGTLQALFLRNSEELWGWIVDGPVLRAIRSSKDPLEELFLSMLSRRPRSEERARFGGFLDGTAETWADAMWILLNSTEFLMRG